MLLKDPTISIEHNDLTTKKGLTVTAIMHNEMYFLPDFLAHYRKLGVERFILLDDKSDDGSFEFAAEQPDVMLLKSDHRYGDIIAAPNPDEQIRAMLAWRNTILNRFCKDQWSLHLDIDEFVNVPDESDFFENLLSRAKDQTNMIWGVMIDMYPQSWDDLSEAHAGNGINDIKWFFDGRQHLKVRQGQKPKIVYSGVRSRLKAKYGLINKKEKTRRKIKRFLIGNPFPLTNYIKKPILVKWSEGHQFANSHRIRNTNWESQVLPIAHYKFTPSLHQKISAAIQSGSYADGSQEYKDFQKLYELMSLDQTPFTGKISVEYKGFESFQQTGNASGIMRRG